VLDCEILYILLIIEHNGEISTEDYTHQSRYIHTYE